MQRSTDEERGNLLGECDLIMSFLCYNDIGAMSQLHRRASSQMSRPAISIQNNGGWTFGSPSVLMMFYRGPGQLESELARWMNVCRIITRLPVVTDRGQKRLCGRKQLLYREDLRMHRLSWNGLCTD